ncbi:hypothetical protein N7463_001681 [Penicillium fimorum]|uniref:Uncharacterized protein n=1 Tax=Penicillium fimorum TaxID=1882269 RepID=A0A9W9XZ98_9EURO|nr:hypothetical protein N7463_001681 [Penicillium fimorum]
MGVGFGIQQPFILAQNARADEDIPIGTAVATFSQTLGGPIFISVGQNVFQNQFKKAMQLEDPSVDIAKVLTAGTTTLRKKLPVEQLPVVLRSYTTAITWAFYVGVALAVESGLRQMCVYNTAKC